MKTNLEVKRNTDLYRKANSREAGAWKEYVCRYFHDGRWWGLNISAQDQVDAEARIAKLGNLQLQGELRAEIQVVHGTGFFVRLMCIIRNFLYGRMV